LGASLKLSKSDPLTSPNRSQNRDNRNQLNYNFSKSNIYNQGSAEDLNMLAVNGDFQTLNVNEVTSAVNIDEFNMQEDRKNF
jgi:hypothetical protein